ncbi:MAG: DUF4350 domain-containing protein [Chloroflexi bacterium]|nr:DUF4350 domain-containing protein [Chloroflexota bacterium]
MQLRQRFLIDFIGIGLVLAGIATAVTITLIQFNNPKYARGSVQNDGPEGTSLLAEWLAEEGFVVNTLDTNAARPSYQDKLILALAPRSPFTFRQLWQLDGWVRSGGTLIVAQEGRQPTGLSRHFGLNIGRLWLPVKQSDLILPALNWPPVSTAVIRARRYLKPRLNCGQAAIHMGDCRRPLFISFGWDDGQVYYLSTAHPFTNEGLADVGNAQLVENLILAGAARGQQISFDEIHQQANIPWLFVTSAGWGILLAIPLVVGFALWHSLPSVPKQTQPTGNKRSLKDGTAVPKNVLAGAQRQFQKSDDIKEHYWLRLKRTLARRAGVDPTLPDEAFIPALKPHLSDAEMGTVMYLAANKDPFPPMSQSELRQWVSTAVTLSDKHNLTREIYEHKKTI